MNTRLSVVVPVYNVEAYLSVCLDSLVAQTVQPMEIIAVDDGSTDACPGILQAYQHKLPQLRIIRQENQGLSCARNTGLAEVTGDYIHFLDSDDFLVPEAYAVMLAEMQKEGQLDILLFNATYHFEGRKEDYPIYRDRLESENMTGADWLVYCLAEKKFMLHMVWMHLYKRNFLLETGLQFIPERIHEDVIWTTKVLLAAKKVRYVSSALIFYRIPIRNFSSDIRDAKYVRVIKSSVLNALELLDISQAVRNERLSDLLSVQAVDGGMSVFHKMEKMNSSDLKKQLIYFMWKKSFFSSLYKGAKIFRLKRKLASKMIRLILPNIGILVNVTVKRLF